MIELQFTPRADADLSECAAFIARDDPCAALRFLDAIEADCQHLCRHPEMGSIRYKDLLPDLGAVHFWPIGGFCNWLIFYVTPPGTILVLRIINGSRDIPALFDSPQ